MRKITKRKQPIGLDNRLSIIAQALNDFEAEGGRYWVTRGDNKIAIWLDGVKLEDRENGRFLVSAD